MSIEQPERDSHPFKSRGVTFLACIPGNFGSVKGEAATLITLAGNGTGDVEQVVMTLDDTRRLAVKLLVSLWTADDDFAGRVLDQMFPHDQDGRFLWPRDDYDR